MEHGKERNIDALPIPERAIQKCLCNNLLTRAYSRSFIYDNGASLAHKGMDFQLKRLKKHLQDHYRKYGTEGGIYQFDFKGYFASLPHDVIKQRARAKIMDDRLYALFCDFVDDFQRMKTADRTAELAARLGGRGGNNGMNYITHRRYKKLALCGKRLNIPYGTELGTVGRSIITQDGQIVCYGTSENAKMHFARNDDGHGLERGKITYAIAYSQRERYSADGRRQRFADTEIEMLRRDWAHFLRPNKDVILFNDDFFAAEIPELQKLANALHIKIRR